MNVPRDEKRAKTAIEVSRSSFSKPSLVLPSNNRDLATFSTSASLSVRSEDELPETEASFVATVSRRLFSNFIIAQPTEGHLDRQPLRKMMSRVVDHAAAQLVMAIVTLVSFVDVVVDTDARACGKTLPAGIRVLQHVLFAAFFMELVARLFIERGLNSVSTCADAVVVVGGFTEYALAIFGISTKLAMLRVLRLARLLKLSRVVYQFPFFYELRKMLYMMGTCIKTLFWSFLVLGVVITAWSIIAVELLNPLAKELADMGQWPDCPRCHRSFASVFDSNITFFQTIVAGDSWGKLAVPIIEQHPWTAIIFVGALLTVVFGVLNVIVAVVVDAFAEARSKDVFTRAHELAAEEKREKKVLAEIFDKIDRNGDGMIDMTELKVGARKVEMFSHWLRVLDIDAGDLEEMFMMLDRDSSGDVSAQEFVEFMYRLKNGDSKTATHFLKQKVSQLASVVGNQAYELERFRSGSSATSSRRAGSKSPRLSPRLSPRVRRPSADVTAERVRRPPALYDERSKERSGSIHTASTEALRSLACTAEIPESVGTLDSGRCKQAAAAPETVQPERFPPQDGDVAPPCDVPAAMPGFVDLEAQ